MPKHDSFYNCLIGDYVKWIERWMRKFITHFVSNDTNLDKKEIYARLNARLIAFKCP